MWHSPHWAVSAVGVPRCHRPHLCPNLCVFVHVHYVVIHGEDGGLVHITHDDLQGGVVLEGAQVGESGVQVRVGSLDVKGVGLLLLKI